MAAMTTPDETPPLWRLLWEKLLRDRITLRAGALSFTTLASLLPLSAIVLAVLSGPAFESQRERVLDQVASAAVPDSQSAYDEVLMLEGADTTRENTIANLKAEFRGAIDMLGGNLGKIGIFSFVVLLFIALQLFGTVEGTFNEIWNVSQGRGLFMKLAITSAMLFWGPVVVGCAVAATAKLPNFALVRFFLPMVLTALAFTAFYMIMPHARVRIQAALAGGASAALLWELSKVGFLVYMKQAVNTSALYGSLSLVPVVFAWVYLSWLVVLTGAEVAYLFQHRVALREAWRVRRRAEALAAQGAAQAPEYARLPALALAAAREVARRYRDGSSPGGITKSALAAALHVEPGPLEQALERLTGGGILARVNGANEEPSADPRYLPASDPARMTLAQLLRAARGSEAGIESNEALGPAAELIARARRDGEQALAAQSFGDWLGEAPAPAAQTAPSGHPA
ncbi:MAG: hypothetical protein AMXMBFR7_33500 [Planctomycetota bacterium]